VTPCLTYGKQRRHFEFTAIWRTRALFKPNFNLLWLLDVNKLCRQHVANAILNLRQYGCYSGNFKLMLTNLNIYYLNKTAIFKYAVYSGNFKLILLLLLV